MKRVAVPSLKTRLYFGNPLLRAARRSRYKGGFSEDPLAASGLRGALMTEKLIVTRKYEGLSHASKHRRRGRLLSGIVLPCRHSCLLRDGIVDAIVMRAARSAIRLGGRP